MRLKKVLCAVVASSLLLTLGVTANNDNVQEVNAATENVSVLFNSNNIKLSSATVNFEDALTNDWVFNTDASYFGSKADYFQIGSANNPATTISLTATMAADITITNFSVDLGGFSGTKGTVAILANDVSVGSGSLNGTSNVTVSSNNSFSLTAGQIIKVDVSGIAKGVKVIGLSYDYEVVVDESKWTVNYETGEGGSVVAKQTVDKGTAIGEENIPEDPTNEGMNFGGWYADETYSTLFDFTTPITADTTVYAKWNDLDVVDIADITTTGEFYRITGKIVARYAYNEAYIQDDSGAIMIYDSSIGTEFTVGNVITFTGKRTVYKNDVEMTSVKRVVVEDDIELSYSPITDTSLISENIYKTVDFDYLKVSAIDGKKYTFDGLTNYAIYTSTDYTTVDTTIVAGDYVKVEGVITGDLEIALSKISKSTVYTVSFVTGTDVTVDSQIVKPNDKATAPATLENYFDNGKEYEFAGWYTDDTYTTAFDFTTPITVDTELVAKWNEKVVTVDKAFVETETMSNLSFGYTDASDRKVEEVNKNISVSAGTPVYDAGFESSTKWDCYKDGTAVYSNALKFDANNEKITYRLNGELTSNFVLTINAIANITSNPTSTFTLTGYNALDEAIENYSVQKIISNKSTSEYMDYVFELDANSNVSYFVFNFMKETGNVCVKTLNVSYTESNVTPLYQNFNNLSLKFKNEFDFTGAVDLVETGMIVTNDTTLFGSEASNTVMYDEDTFAMLQADSAYQIFVNEEKLSSYIVAITVTDEQLASIADTPLLAVSYVKTSEGYFFNTSKVVSVSDMLLTYSASDATISYADGTVVKVADLATAFIDQLTA